VDNLHLVIGPDTLTQPTLARAIVQHLSNTEAVDYVGDGGSKANTSHAIIGVLVKLLLLFSVFVGN
jgi:hypothetical protein